MLCTPTVGGECFVTRSLNFSQILQQILVRASGIALPVHLLL